MVREIWNTWKAGGADTPFAWTVGGRRSYELSHMATWAVVIVVVELAESSWLYGNEVVLKVAE